MPAPFRSVLALFIGVVIFAGLPLLGWGLYDIQGFTNQPARLGYVVQVVLLQIFVAILFPGIGRTGGTGKKLVRRQQVTVFLLQVISLSMVIAPPFCDRRGIATMDEIGGVRYLGLVLFAAGFLVMNWSEATLGKLFSVQVTIQENHQLVTGGPYRILRHPRYFGIIVLNLGLALVFRSWLGLIIVAMLTAVLLWRIHDEETLMRQEFGADWDVYARKSWHLIPFVY